MTIDEKKARALFDMARGHSELGVGYKDADFELFKKDLDTDSKFQEDFRDDLVTAKLLSESIDIDTFRKGLKTSQPSQPPAVSLAPPQRQSIEQQAAGQATGFVPPMAVQPMQATGQPQTGQIIELTGEPQTGEFRAEIVNGKKVYMPQGITAGGEEFIDEGTDVSKDPTGQYQSTGVLIDDRGQTLNEGLQNIVTGTPQDKQGLAYQNAQNVKNDAKSTWQRLKETGSGLLTSAKTQADAAMGFLDTVLNPMSFIPGASKPVSQGGFGGETNLAKGAKKEFIRTALDGEKELNNKIQELGLQTDIVDAVKSGRGSDIIQAINHNIGQMAYQVPLSISTFGASSFAMEGAEAYKGIVDAQAKELGITADELIERGLDKQALGIGVGAISGAVDYLGAKSLASFINAGGAYEQLAKAIASKLPKKYGTGFLTRAAVASNAEGFQESIQEGVKLGGERIASGKWDPNALNRLGKSYANAAVGAGGTYVGGRTVNAALNPSESITLNTFNNAPVIGQAPQQGGFDAVILADQINQGKKVDIQSALSADAYLDSEIQRQGENVSPELLEHKKTISEFIDKENEFAPRRQARKDVLPDGSVLYFVGSEAEVPEEFKDRAKPSTSTRDGKPVGSFSFTLTPEEDAAYQQGVPPPSGADQTTYETVTPEELQAFRQGQIDPERAAAIADDVALIQSGQMDINSIDDANYRLMVESAMGAGQQQQEQGDAAELSQINDRILTIKAAAQEGRIEGDPAEYAALKKRKAELESQVKTEVEVETDPAVADIERRREEELAKFREDNPIQLRPIEVLDQNGNVIQSSSGEFAINKKYDAEIAALNEQLPLADQAAQNMGTAVNQPLETGAAAVEVGESGRPVVEVEGDQVVEEEKPTQQIAATEMALEDLIAESESFDEKIKAEKERLDRIAPNRQIIGGADIDNLSPEDAARYVELNDEIGRRQGTSQEAAKQRVAEKREQRKAETKTQQITDLRAKEQAEYDAMSDPNDQKKRDEIYDRYDKLISPLLGEKAPKAEAPKAEIVSSSIDNLSNKEKEQLIELLRNPLFDLVRGTELYNKYKGETIPYGYSESSWNLLISGINESKLDLNKILLGYKKRLLEEEATPIRKTSIDKKTGLPKGFNPSTGQFEGGFGEASEKENSITKSKQKIAVLEKFIKEASTPEAEAPKAKGKATIIIEEKPKEPLIPKQKLEKIKEKVKSDPNVLLRTGKIEGKNTGFFAIPEQGGPFVDDSFNDLGVNEETSAYTMPNDFKVKDLSNMVFDDYKKNKEDEKARAEGYDGVKIMEMDGTTVMDVVNPKKLIKLDESLPELRNEKLQEASSKTRKAEGGQSAKQSSEPTEKKPRKRGRSINVQAAMNVQLPNNKEAAVMQTILENPLSEDILQSIFGGPDTQAKSGRKSIKGERSARISMLKKNGVKSVGKMAELAASKLAEWDGSPDAMPNDFSDGLEDLVIDTILNYNSKESIAKDLLAMANLEQQQFDEQWYAGQQNEDLVRESEGIVDALTDEEFVELLGLEDEGVAEFLDNWNEERAESEKSPEQKEAEKIVSEAKQKVSDAEKALKQASNAAGQSLNVPLGEKTPLGLTVQRGNADAQRKVKEAETALELAKSDLGKAESQLDKLKGKKTSQLEIDTKANPLTPFQTKDKEGQAARAALKESVGPKEYKRLENIAKNGEKILKDLQSRQILKIDCP